MFCPCLLLLSIIPWCRDGYSQREDVLSYGCQSIVSFIPLSDSLEYKRDKRSIIRKGSGKVEVSYGIQGTSSYQI